MPNLSSPPTRIQDVNDFSWKTWFALLHDKIEELEASIDSPSSSSTEIPSGGASGQVLARTSGGGLQWIDLPIGIPAGGVIGEALYKQSNVNYDVDWGAPEITIEFSSITASLAITPINPTIELILNVSNTVDSLVLTENSATIT